MNSLIGARMIKIVMNQDVPFVWDADDWLELRKRHRIIGCFDGAEGEGWTNSIHLNLPFKLAMHEVRYLVKAGIAQTFDIPKLKKLLPPVEENIFLEHRKCREAKEFEEHKKKKRRDIEFTVDKIIEGKRRKGREVGDRETVIEEELAKFKAFPYETVIFDLRDPWVGDSDLVPYILPDFKTPLERLRYRVFEDFYSNLKYYLTTGIKFGGDFIAYKGDPLEHHAEYIIMCEDNERKFTTTYLLSQCRLAATLKKKLLVATHDDQTDELNYRLICRPQVGNTTELNP